MIIDAHAHLFTRKIISNVKNKKELVKKIGLQTHGAEARVGVETIEPLLKAAGVDACLILPTASAGEVTKTNDRFYELVKGSDLLSTAGTLHPDFAGNRQELLKFRSRKIRAIKLCSFSQGFALDGPKTQELFNLISEFNQAAGCPFYVVLDTFYEADTFFGTPAAHNTTPRRLAELARKFPRINFIGAHMGGLAAPFEELVQFLTPAENLFLDTSNAAHVLTEAEFVQLVRIHGAGHIIFGTDWPWFEHSSEMALIERLLDTAGYSAADKDRVFAGNIRYLLNGAGPRP